MLVLGYGNSRQYSGAAIKWLEWLMQEARPAQAPIQIRHAQNGHGEYTIPGTGFQLDR